MWVLLEQSKSKPGKEVYFKGWEDYQPATTMKVRKALGFDSKEAAKLSAAYRHKEFSFIPIEVEIGVGRKNKAAA